MATKASANAKVQQFVTDVDIAHQIVHGGTAVVVATEGGQVRSFAKLVNDLEAQFNAGFGGIFDSVIGEYAIRAEAARDAALTAATAAGTAADTAQTSAGTAEESREAAVTARNEAETIVANVADSVAAAAASASAADTSADQAASALTSATTAASTAVSAKDAAAISATNAGNSATAAANSASAASGSATTADGHKTAAASSATAAATARTGAETAATNAATSATNADTAESGAVAAATSAEEERVAAEVARDEAEAFAASIDPAALVRRDGSLALTGQLKFAPVASIAAAGTIDLTAVGASSNLLFITGTAAIAAWTMVDGQSVDVVFTGAGQMTHHATNNNLEGGKNFNRAVNDRATVTRFGSGVFLKYHRADGLSVVPVTGASGGGEDKFAYAADKVMTADWIVPQDKNWLIPGPLDTGDFILDTGDAVVTIV